MFAARQTRHLTYIPSWLRLLIEKFRAFVVDYQNRRNFKIQICAPGKPQTFKYLCVRSNVFRSFANRTLDEGDFKSKRKRFFGILLGEYSDPPLEDLLDWIQEKTPKDAAFAGNTTYIVTFKVPIKARGPCPAWLFGTIKLVTRLRKLNLPALNVSNVVYASRTSKL